MNAMIFGTDCAELHEGTGTGLDLVTEEVLAEVIAMLEPLEPYYELHVGMGTGLDLKAAEVVRQAEAILRSAWEGSWNA
ncbi:MAG TPA: hypothetical protein VGA61_03755 [Anaerolineae bacterium]